MDACITAAGILNPDTDCLEYDSKAFQKVCCIALLQEGYTMLTQRQVMETNVNGSLFTAQAAARQMVRFGNGGSIILIASLSGSIANRVRLIACLFSTRADGRRRAIAGSRTTPQSRRSSR